MKLNRQQLRGLIEEAFGDDHHGSEFNMFLEDLEGALFDMDEVADVRSFADAGLMTSNKGFVVTMTNGDTFQVSAVPGRPH